MGLSGALILFRKKSSPVLRQATCKRLRSGHFQATTAGVLAGAVTVGTSGGATGLASGMAIGTAIGSFGALVKEKERRPNRLI